VHIEISANSENNRFNITVLIESVNRKLTVAECGSSRHWRFNNGWITAQYRQMDDPAVFLIVMLFGSEGIFFFLNPEMEIVVILRGTCIYSADGSVRVKEKGL